MDEAKEREAFEAWAMSEFGLASLPTRKGDGYLQTGIDDSWAGWKGRAAKPVTVGFLAHRRLI